MFKVNIPSDLEKIQKCIVLALCHLENIFPLSLFDVMEHLPVYLTEEAFIAGPIQFRWMYPIERYTINFMFNDSIERYTINFLFNDLYV